MTALLAIDNPPPTLDTSATVDFLEGAVWVCLIGAVVYTLWAAAAYVLAQSKGSVTISDGGRVLTGLAAILGCGLAAAAPKLVRSLIIEGDAAEPAVDAAPAPEQAPDTSVDIPWDIIGLILLLAAGVTALGFAVARFRRNSSARKRIAQQNAADHAAALKVYDTVAAAYAEHLADPHSFFERPLLDDITDDRTAAFIDAFANAGHLRTDTVPVDPDRTRRFVDATSLAHRTWIAAHAHATKIGFTHPTFDKRTVERITASITVAQNDSATPDERRAALDAVARLTDGALRVPDRVTTGIRAAIDTAARKQLTTGRAAH
ncbi:hypothetical protein HQ325_02860 [Rhodococcus sp. BP-349]|uniref:hypothetical protein n=1 Tax=unclassified Rhodococcus (in: high G+C Gram-positive bacteria) TaxID=192944 RepID=UPI001C9A8375|nr:MULTISPECIES: hypothetical protein [unclassified Rhodococcus (in: high G+C Gram-positive bacteria)]MBY6537604.1 hypothetical protein [Rhodococcus sp. BP-363]MBY6541941.1 hypothetical protein [Rhodococcus sp. BP-369]MBY6561171.1 hypothetical protein [Rhodococcus sp. BP-370]MBY6575463.1 hypothetical protein [Rhodococcus sp. BP-364]MBY6584764.1 hypothetical protein [Rhodococcus sp. BP-358]